MTLKQLLLISLALLAATTMLADPVLVPVRPVPTPPTDGDPARSPVALPVFYLDGYTLTASSYTVGSTVELLDEDDNVVFSTYIYIEGDIQLDKKPIDFSIPAGVLFDMSSITSIHR